MRETIYTIPLTESLEQNSECPFCFLENKLEQERIDYCLGPAMMEPDHRTLSNELGYCHRHFQMLSEKKRALPFALVMDTRMDAVINVLEDAKKQKKTRKVFSRKKTAQDPLICAIQKNISTCLVCDKIAHTMSKFLYTFWYLYKSEPDFREKIRKSKGFCLHHFCDILKAAEKYGGAKREQYLTELTDLELANLKRSKDDVHQFVKQFDYRSDKEHVSVPKNAPYVCGGKLSGFEQEG